MSYEASSPLILALDDPTAVLEQVGGKGASLARLAAAGLAVPAGFCITTTAYDRFVLLNQLQVPIMEALSAISPDQPSTLERAATQIADLFTSGHMPDEIEAAICQAYARSGGDDLAVAVRSSATAEDLPEMSFAGQQESYLNVHGAAMVVAAVKRCWSSLWTARAIDYRFHHHIAHDAVSLAVVVQQLVPAEAAGVLFTANPLTGMREQIVINAAWGLGEAIVGGKVTPDTLLVGRASHALISQQISTKNVMTVLAAAGTREESVPVDQRTRPVLSRTQAAELARIGIQIEDLYGLPMDIEWALHQGRFFIVQARPITALRAQVAPVEWNDSLYGNYLWTSGNLGEAVPDVMTPCTWSLVKIFMAKTLPTIFIQNHQPIGNIGGRLYMNLSLPATISTSIGLSRDFFTRVNQEVFGTIPDDLEIPIIPISRWRILSVVLIALFSTAHRVKVNQQQLPAFFTAAPARCEALRAHIQAITNPSDLRAFWASDLEPYFHTCCSMLEAGARSDGNALVLTRLKLRKMVGEVDTNALLSSWSSGTGPLESLGPLLGLTQLARGEIDQAAFARQYGHRGPHEFEVSQARPAEDPAWIDQQLANLRDAPLDVATLLARQQEVHKAAWERFCQRYPRQAKSMRRRINRTLAALHDREVARSEVIRVFWALRTFMQRAAELTGQGDDIFFLTIQETLLLLRGDLAPLVCIPARRAAYDRYRTLPPYPRLISGSFDPFRWAADPQRRSDLFDAHKSPVAVSDGISGFAGAVGIVEGYVRVIASPEEGDQLQPGEILVTTVTNIGWTPLFPRASAVVTDIGAPLSHAAIVARELGIPAVVGCGNATALLRSGDWVRVNGEKGMVEILRPKPEARIAAEASTPSSRQQAKNAPDDRA